MMRKAQVLMAQGYPILLMSVLTRMGKTTPPKLEPVANMPKARPLRLWNQPLVHPRAHIKTEAEPMALHTP